MKKFLFIFFILFTLLPCLVFALTNKQKWAIMEMFKSQQYDLLFESDLWNISSQYSDIFNISKKVDIYNSISSTVEKQRIEIQRKTNELSDKITSLEEAITLLDKDILKLTSNINQINKDVIETKSAIESNEKTIKILKSKIAENREILLEYLVYIYKKWNTWYTDEWIDNLKTMLLNDQNIWEYINDLYYKWVIQMAWKKLLDNHMEFINELYIKKIALETEEVNLKKLRKESIIEKKVLNDKKIFKEKLLTISKWKQSFYEKYMDDKIKTENNLKIKALKENLKFKSIRNNILEKYNCEYVDITKNTIEVRNLSDKCYDINNLILSETKLKNDSNIIKQNFFDWPVNPYFGISAYFIDAGYLELFWTKHDAIDIVIPQWTPVKAAANWYVIYIEDPDSEDYAYLALKHYNWFITVYWHVNEILVEPYEYVEVWQTIAKSGWELWTNWAWFMTTWPHLHFEVFQDKIYVDPLLYLDTSYIKYETLLSKYKIKYFNDFRERKWYEFKDKKENSRTFRLEWTNEIERQKYLLNKYAVWTFNNWDMWLNLSLEWNIDPSFAMCIWLAETTLWKYVKTPYNIWNVWNTDSWATKTFKDAETGVYRMIQTLNNRYLSQYNELHMLSRYWNTDKSKPIYASSPDNWHNNIIKCLSHLKWSYVPDDFNFRLIK